MNNKMKLSEHMTLGELTKTKTGINNVPNEEQVNNLKRLCGWLEKLRKRWNDLYGDGDDPIIINSGFRSPEVNRVVGGATLSKQKKRGKKPLFCTPAGARTLDTLIKSQVLYQLSYGCIVFSIAGAKVRSIFESTKLFRDFFQKKVGERLISSKNEPFSCGFLDKEDG